jgi:hypothetical protein
MSKEHAVNLWVRRGKMAAIGNGSECEVEYTDHKGLPVKCWKGLPFHCLFI